jgi:CRP-like cAMP-binding protein
MPPSAPIVGLVGRLLALKRLPLLATLPTSELTLVAERTRERLFPKGGTLLREGEPVGAIYFVVDGRVHLSRHGLPLGHAGPGSAVGGLGVLARDSEGVEARAEADTLVLELDVDTMFEIFDDRFLILNHVIRDVCRELIDGLSRLPSDKLPLPPPIDLSSLPTSNLDLVERIMVLRHAPVFAEASINALAGLSRAMAEVVFEPGVTLWREGEVSGSIFLILSGSAQCTLGSGARFSPGPGFPLGSAESIGERPRWYHTITERKLVALHVHKDELIDVFEDNTEMAMSYLAATSRSLLTVLDRFAEGRLDRFYGCEEAGTAAPAPA